ncbi:MAG: hypothetical protein HY902_09545 [Deltaproteobacteria bacterium]|nr:hypothetical protein [Deltaproteobacteria bacterium]
MLKLAYGADAFYRWLAVAIRTHAPAQHVDQLLRRQVDPNHRDTAVIYIGGTKPSDPKLVSSFGLAAHGKFVIRSTRAGHELCAYAFTVAKPAADGTPRNFVRLDLNAEFHVDPNGEPRSHLHPSHDYVRIPTAVLHPKELLLWFFGAPLWAVAGKLQ